MIGTLTAVPPKGRCFMDNKLDVASAARLQASSPSGAHSGHSDSQAGERPERSCRCFWTVLLVGPLHLWHTETLSIPARWLLILETPPSPPSRRRRPRPLK